jgi:chitinase domain-containing protein 1
MALTHSRRPGPSAPLDWVWQNVQRLLDRGARLPRAPNRGVLLGLSFFGNDFALPQGGGPILGHEFLSLLERCVPHPPCYAR